MELANIWFVLWGILWAVFFTTDGFDFGAGMLHTILGGKESERRAMLNAVGPVWDGNQVWLITAGGATFAAFPTTYALMFSYLYTPLLLLLFSLILRGVAIEFRSKKEEKWWTGLWDYTLVISNLLLALLFGVAFGNIFAGLPMDADGYHGSLLGMLNGYGLLTGVFFVLLFAMHGALFIAIKTEGELSQRAGRLADRIWFGGLGVAVAFLILTWLQTGLKENYIAYPLWAIIPVIAVLSLAGVKYFSVQKRYVQSFIASCTTIFTVVITAIVGLYPNLIPSSIDPEYGLSISRTASSPYTLAVMTIVAAIFVPIVIVYQIWVHRLFRTRLDSESTTEQNVY